MGKKDFTNIEKQIRDAVEDAINSLDFKQLNKTIAGTISGAVDEVRRQFNGSSWSSGRGSAHDRESDIHRGDNSYREADPRRGDNSYRETDPYRGDSSYGEADPRRGDSSYREADSRRGDSSYRKADSRRGDSSYGEANPRRGDSSYREADSRRGDTYYRNARVGQPAENRQSGPKGWQKTGSTAAKRSTPPSQMDKLRIHPPGKAESVLLIVFGAIGLSISLIGLAATLLGTLFLFTIPLLSWFLTTILLIIGGISGFMLGRGCLLRGRRRRLDSYLKEAGNRTYCTIRALVGRIGKTEKYILRDLKRMIKLGILPHAHIDQEQTCLMLDDKTYEQYLKSMESLKQRTLSAQSVEHDPAMTEAGHQSDHTVQSGQDHKQTDGEDRISRMISEGRLYLKALREANEAIPGEVITAKLFRLEIIIDKIFQVAAKHPQQADDMERFMEYYLPTTLKLVNAYRDFDLIGISGDNITMVKTDVEATLDTINTAFEQLLDSLYQDEAFDISTDASVLQTMLKKDGYGSSDFIKEESK